jgi:hypothetical protein
MVGTVCPIYNYFIGRFNLWDEVTLLWSPGKILQVWFLCFTIALINSLPPPHLPATASVSWVLVGQVCAHAWLV